VAAGFIFDVPARWLDRVKSVIAFACAIPAGLIPWVLGRARIDQYLYRPVTIPMTSSRLWERVVETVTSDFWSFLGAHGGTLGIACAIALVALFLAGIRRIEWKREDFILFGTLVVSFAFWIVSPQAYSGALRYLSIALPIFLAVCGLGAVTMWRSGERIMRIAAPVLALAAGLNLYGDRIADTRKIVTGNAEQHERWPGGFDPRPALAQIDAAGYRVCYADFWIAYKLEWLSTSGVQFIPYRSVNRTQTRSLQLAAENGPKCFVSNDGIVHPLSSQEESRFRVETIAAVQRANRKRG